MKYENLDAFEMSFEECAADKKYKLNTTKGVGEARIYVGHDKESLDEFFELDTISFFIMKKSDIVKYLKDAKDEYYNPTQDYKEKISDYYENNMSKIEVCSKDELIMRFTSKYDSQNRYYLNFADSESRTNWYVFRDVALPRVTKLQFLKLRNAKSGKKIIFIKPMFYIDDRTKEEKIEKEIYEKLGSEGEKEYRKHQAEYREKLLDIMPFCLITSISEDRLLQACHIKPYSKCETEEEKYDVHNGIILTPTYHKLFDYGFISFKDTGEILISPFLSVRNRKLLNLVENKKYRVQKASAKYLKYHRENIFNQIPDISL